MAPFFLAEIANQPSIEPEYREETVPLRLSHVCGIDQLRRVNAARGV
jgi:hypothetical protein